MGPTEEVPPARRRRAIGVWLALLLLVVGTAAFASLSGGGPDDDPTGPVADEVGDEPIGADDTRQGGVAQDPPSDDESEDDAPDPAESDDGDGDTEDSTAEDAEDASDGVANTGRTQPSDQAVEEPTVTSPGDGVPGTDDAEPADNAVTDTEPDPDPPAADPDPTPPAATPEPPEAADVSATAQQDGSVTITLMGWSPRGSDLTYDVVQPANGTVTGTGPDVTYTPDPGYWGSDSFTYTVDDGSASSSIGTVTITVGPLPPTADAKTAGTTHETPVDITLTATVPSGEPVTYLVGADPSNGSVSILGDTATYVPDPGYWGPDAFSYVADDGQNPSAPATVTVSVDPPAPTASDVTGTTTEDTSFGMTLLGSSGAGLDLDYSYTQPTNGTVTGTGPNVTYTPDPGFYGVDTFAYTADDTYTTSNVATVTVTVNTVAADFSFSTVGNTPLGVGTTPAGPSKDVTGSLLDTNPSGFTLDSVDDSAADGTVLANADGTFEFRPAPGFTGTDTFTYTLTDGSVFASGQVDVEVQDMVWYVSAGASGDGRGHSPFGTLAAAESASAAGEAIFVLADGGTIADSIQLKASQQLIGEAAGLVVGGDTLFAPGNRPTLASPSDAVPTIGLASGSLVRSVDVSGAAGDGVAAADIGGSATVEDVNVTLAGEHGIVASGTTSLTLTGVDVTNSGGSAFVADTLTGTVTHSGNISHAGSAAAVTLSAIAAGSSVSLDTVESDDSGITVTTNDGSVTIADASVGTFVQPANVPALSVSANTGTVALLAVDGWVDGARGIDVAGAGTVRIDAGAIHANGAEALHASGSTLDVTLSTVSSSSSAGDGVRLHATSGSVDLQSGSITGSSGDGLEVAGGSVTLTSAVDITNAAGRSFVANGTSGADLTVSGDVTDTGDGVRLTTNTGSTVRFTGRLDLTTNGRDAFVATGGGVVEVADAASTIDTTNGRGLVVQSTTVGAGGVTFESVSASNATDGIVLASTGSGPITVAGDGSTTRNGSGGTITGMSGDGVSLANTGPVTLRNMDIVSNTANAIEVDGVSGLSVVAATIDGNTSAPGDTDTRNSVWVRNLGGTLRIQDSLVRGSVHDQVDVAQTSGTATVQIVDTTLDANSASHGVAAVTTGSADLTLEVSDSTFTATADTGIRVRATQSSRITASVTDSTLDGGLTGIGISAEDGASVGSTVTGNTILSQSTNLALLSSNGTATHDAIFSDNTMNGSATTGNGAEIVSRGTGAMVAQVSNNTITSFQGVVGISTLAESGSAAIDLRLTDNAVVAATSFGWGYEIVALSTSNVCAAATGNSATSGSFAEGLLFDIDTNASGRLEGAPLGPLGESQTESYLQSANPSVDSVLAYVLGTLTGVAPSTCASPAP